MSNEPDDASSPEGKKQAGLTRWLQSFLPEQWTASNSSSPPATSLSAAHLLQRAARCYALAQWDDDACRVCEQLGYYVKAAQYHERQGRWVQAAQLYSRAAQWPNAARCYLKCNHPAEAAECLLRSGDSLRAAWYLAELAHHFIRAESIARNFERKSGIDELTVDLIIARCHAGTGAHADGARRLIAGLGRLGQPRTAAYLVDWALAVAEALHRPDLVALVYAAAIDSGYSNAVDRWRQWSAQRIGCAFILPPDTHEMTS
jgi:tetratricopeptide (TPR) repeat protein